MALNVGDIQQKRGTVHVEWHIESYFSYEDENECLRSDVFYLTDETEWWFHLHPDGDTGNRGYLSLYLIKGRSAEKYNINFTLSMMKRDGSVYHTVDCNYSFEERYTGYGSSRFLLRLDLLKSRDTVASDGVLRIFCIIRFADFAKETACGNPSPKSLDSMTENLKNLYLDGRLCDVTLTVKGKDFRSHKFILVAHSPVFAAMFEHDMVEKMSSTVTITDCDPNLFNDFLLFLYAGKLENVSRSNVFGLYETADKYDVKELKQECVQLMEHNLSVDTFSDTILFAIKYKESKLLKSTTEFFTDNVEIILPTTMWELFMAENSGTAKELFMKVLKIKPVTEKE